MWLLLLMIRIKRRREQRRSRLHLLHVKRGSLAQSLQLSQQPQLSLMLRIPGDVGQRLPLNLPGVNSLSPSDVVPPPSEGSPVAPSQFGGQIAQSGGVFLQVEIEQRTRIPATGSSPRSHGKGSPSVGGGISRPINNLIQAGISRLLPRIQRRCPSRLLRLLLLLLLFRLQLLLYSGNCGLCSRRCRVLVNASLRCQIILQSLLKKIIIIVINCMGRIWNRSGGGFGRHATND